MHAAILLPRFQLQSMLRGQPPAMARSAVALLDAVSTGSASSREQARVLHVSRAAERFRVQPGMTSSQAQARCPRLNFLYRDAEVEAAAHKELLACAAQRTPYYEATAPGLCVLDLSHVRHLTGKEQACGESIHQQLRQHQLHAAIGFASNTELAVLAAHAARPVRVMRGDEETHAFLHELPLTTLRPSREMKEVLHLWGVHSVGDFVQLPRAGVAERLGQEGAVLWDMAAGGHQRLLKLIRPPADYRHEEDLEHPIECLDPLLFVLRRVLQALCERLSDAWLVASAIVLELRFADLGHHLRELRVAEPCRDAEMLFRVVHTCLDGYTAEAPIVGFVIELKPARPSGSQSLLFERSLRDPNRFAETLAQLEAILGTGRVGKARLIPSRKLDAFTMVSFFEKSADSGDLYVEGQQAVHGLPLRRYRPVIPVQVMMADEKPVALHNHHLTHTITPSRRPWLVSGDWWDAQQAWRREVWIVATEEGTLYQLVRQEGQWVLEGTLG